MEKPQVLELAPRQGIALAGTCIFLHLTADCEECIFDKHSSIELENVHNGKYSQIQLCHIYSLPSMGAAGKQIHKSTVVIFCHLILRKTRED